MFSIKSGSEAVVLPHTASHPGSSTTTTSATIEHEPLLPHFLGLRRIVCQELHSDRTVMEYGLEFEHCGFFITSPSEKEQPSETHQWTAGDQDD